MTDVQMETESKVYANDLVPDPWKGLFTNEEWLMHDIVVKATYGFMVIAVIAHTLVFLAAPWIQG